MASTAPSLFRLGMGIADCARRLPDLAAAAGPFGWPGPAQRERLLRDAAAAAGADRAASRHAAFVTLYGHPVEVADTGPDGEVDRRRTRRRRALAAYGGVEVEVDRAFDLLRRPSAASPIDVAVAVVVASLTAPAVGVSTVSAGLARRLATMAPPVPPIRRPRPDRANLLVTLVADALPNVLSSALVRHVVLRIPSEVAIGLRSGRSTATVTLGRRGIRVTNGLGRNAVVVIDGNVNALLRRASGTLADELVDAETPG